MGLCVEVMCDVRDETPIYVGAIFHRCESYGNNNPQGRSVAEARAAARKAGWVVIGGWTCCPGCKDTEKGRAAIAALKSGAPDAQ